MLCCLGLTTSVASSVGSIAVISDRNTEKVRVVHIYIFICTGYRRLVNPVMKANRVDNV